jgi:hypothetical protein
MAEFIGSVWGWDAVTFWEDEANAYMMKVRGYRWYQGVTFGMGCALIWRKHSWPEPRYVGTLHEINSETSTVALENVSSFGTEGRKSDPSEEIPPSDSVYEYIVFRGSDVKDLRVEEPPAAKENKAPRVPNDPAIMEVRSNEVRGAVQLALCRCLCDEIFRMLTHIVSESAKPCGDFRCLPSDFISHPLFYFWEIRDGRLLTRFI